MSAWLDNKTLRVINLLRLKDEYGTLARVASSAGVQLNYLYTVMSSKSPRAMGDEVARKLEAATGKVTGWIDTPPPNMTPRLYTLGRMATEGINAHELAQKTGMNDSTLHRIINEHGEPRRDTLKPLAAYFGVSVDAFFSAGHHPKGLELDEVLVWLRKELSDNPAAAGRLAQLLSDHLNGY